jgi:hypothetical protein
MGITNSTQRVSSFQENIANTLNETSQNISQNTGASSSTQQSIRIENIQACGGDINISNIGQKTAIRYNLSQFASATGVAELQAATRNAIESLASKDLSVSNELGGLGATNDSQTQETFNTNVTNMVNKITLLTVQSITSAMDADQSVVLLDFSTVCGEGKYGQAFGGDINIDNISQDIQLELFIEQIAQLSTSVYSEIVANNDAKVEAGQATRVENTGFASILSAWFSGITGIIVTIIVVLLLLIAIIVIPVVVIRRRGKRKATQAAQAAQVAQLSQASAAPSEMPSSAQPTSSGLEKVLSSPQVQSGAKKLFSKIGSAFNKYK